MMRLQFVFVPTTSLSGLSCIVGRKYANTTWGLRTQPTWLRVSPFLFAKYADALSF